MMDLTGHIYGRLTVLSRAERKNGRLAWNCQCSCGNLPTVAASNLRTGNTNSCGCLNLENKATQGGGYIDAEYQSWKGMVSRSTNTSDKDYIRYGAKGIGVHLPWISSFQDFKNYIGPKPTPKHSIDRIKGSKGYVPGNVRWATSAEQSANRKNTAMVEYQGVRQPLALLARMYGLCPMLVNKRVFHCDWSVEKALNTPVT